jgi:hypothetical protein
MIGLFQGRRRDQILAWAARPRYGPLALSAVSAVRNKFPVSFRKNFARLFSIADLPALKSPPLDPTRFQRSRSSGELFLGLAAKAKILLRFAPSSAHRWVENTNALPHLQNQIEIAKFMPEITPLDCFVVCRVDCLRRDESCQQI